MLLEMNGSKFMSVTHLVLCQKKNYKIYHKSKDQGHKKTN